MAWRRLAELPANALGDPRAVAFLAGVGEVLVAAAIVRAAARAHQARGLRHNPITFYPSSSPVRRCDSFHSKSRPTPPVIFIRLHCSPYVRVLPAANAHFGCLITSECAARRSHPRIRCGSGAGSGHNVALPRMGMVCCIQQSCRTCAAHMQRVDMADADFFEAARSCDLVWRSEPGVHAKSDNRCQVLEHSGGCRSSRHQNGQTQY